MKNVRVLTQTHKAKKGENLFGVKYYSNSRTDLKLM